MNKALKYLVLATMVVGTVNADSSETNKTYMNGRSAGTDLTIWYGAGMQEIINRKDKDKFGGTFFATGFYKDGEMGAEYWTPADKNGFDIGQYVYFLDPGDLFPAVNKDIISFDPEQETFGVTLAYDQRLDSILKGLYFNVQLPIVHVENDLGLTIPSTAVDRTALLDFFAGKAIAKGSFASIDPLKSALIDGEDSTTGIADIDVRLGYNFLNKCKYHVGLNIGLTIPTGTDVDGHILNQAVVGNGNHFGLGGGLNFDARIWGTCEHNFIVYGDLKYRYLFEASEKRTLGLGSVPYSYYNYLVVGPGASRVLPANINLVPAANVLTTGVDVTPGSEFDGIIALAYNNGGFNANLGYNLYVREEEEVELKGTNPFEKTIYSLITDRHVDPVTFDTTTIVPTAISTDPATTESQVSHKIFGGLAWTFKNWETPVNIGVGGHYEFMEEDEGYENWGVNARLGIGF